MYGRPHSQCIDELTIEVKPIHVQTAHVVRRLPQMATETNQRSIEKEFPNCETKATAGGLARRRGGDDNHGERDRKGRKDPLPARRNTQTTSRPS